MKFSLVGLALAGILSSAHGALPGDSVNGKRLHNANCLGCHDAAVYSRPDRTIKSLDALRVQLDGCSHMAHRKFSLLESQDILKYLNDDYYHFP
ncbi:MAG: hypothetical protein KDH15_00700 [Rhodocyclaceae bacterium]|nr:hypothetical protein [Rhodocyclaceae bacterium]